ncbi:uncharacterized protein HD556DRAFT_1306744 [Suillus plorans]|uniref:Uncharacterized protein n=1 Tax=Suillus plorans TaxID=116603 RepID=A0A9P7DKH1_9AGAM|nr:uncharacterized protein HD556DRAFT_1306744 [Suillus plorans]KAG1797047.1 hypothetical protein HD556DRAFT_1306744 [Suillus plorans]
MSSFERTKMVTVRPDAAALAFDLQIQAFLDIILSCELPYDKGPIPERSPNDARKPIRTDELDPRLERPPQVAEMDAESFEHEYTKFLSRLAIECNWHCNTDTQIIGSGEAAKAAVFYITEYITKGDLPMHVALQALEYATKMHDAKYITSSEVDPKKKDCNLLTKSVNAMMGRQEMSHQQVMSYLIGGGDYYTSHTFETVKWYEFIHAADRFDLEGTDSDDGDQTSDQEVDTSLMDGQVIMSVSSDKVEFSSDMADYILHPTTQEFTDLCLWQFVENTIKIKGNISVDKESDEEYDEDIVDGAKPARRRGRKALPRAKFLAQHSQFDTHILRLRKKKVIPVLLGNALPHPDRSEEEYEKYCRAMMLLFKPWRDLGMLKDKHMSWRGAFDNMTFDPAISSIIRNMNIENECKEARDTHAAAVKENRRKPHMFGNNVTEDIETQLDIDTFDDALLSNTALDEDEFDDIDKGMLFEAHPACGAEIADKTSEGRLHEYESIMKAARKRKRPIDVGSNDTESKRAHLNPETEQLEENVDITSVYYKPELTQNKREEILSEVITEFRLSENPEQEMNLRIISEHFIRGEVKQLLMFITGIGGSGKAMSFGLLLKCFGGSAAVLIDGYTIHALMFLPKREAPIKQQDLETIESGLALNMSGKVVG